MTDNEYKPFVPADKVMSEFTIRALVLGLVMCVVLGAANAYLGLRAGMTIAATYPAAVIGMAVLRLMKGSLLEENFARTVGSIGESVAAGAAFTLPAFVMLSMWKFDREHMLQEYLVASALMILGGVLGIMFVTILRRVMVEDRSLPFPESVAASEIHKAGQRGAEAAKQLFQAMGVGALIEFCNNLNIFRGSNSFPIKVGEIGRSILRLGNSDDKILKAGGVSTFSAPAVSPAYLGVGYIIGPELGALNFAGGLLAWGLLVPLLVFFLGPGMIGSYTSDGVQDWSTLTNVIYLRIARPIAVGGMLVGACYTLFRMRQRLVVGLKRSISDVKKSATAATATQRTDQDIKFFHVLMGIGALLVLITALYFYFTGSLKPALLAAIVILVTGFFFAAVSGNLVGTIGSSNNPLSGLALATTIVAALTMVIVGTKGSEGVAAVLGVAAVGCISAAVAGEMLQDLKVGHILGGTPWKMEVGDIIGVVVAGLVLFFPFYMMHTSDVAQFGEAGGFGGRTYPAPQAGLMAALSQGIVGGEMAWPLVIVGIAMGFSLILIKVRNPMLFSVGMYLPLETTFAIFVGGVIRGIVDKIRDKRGHNDAQKARVENAGILCASGLIAGQSLIGLLVAAVIYFRSEHAFWTVPGFSTIVPWFNAPIAQLLALPVVAIIIWYLIAIPLSKAGAADEPAPPTAVM